MAGDPAGFGPIGGAAHAMAGTIATASARTAPQVRAIIRKSPNNPGHPTRTERTRQGTTQSQWRDLWFIAEL
ncbi:hypothetical protein AAEH90_21435, partial [Shewanella algae]|uniref:hypothetical protein n=1 Tax=Shewanella algae TaxID=38313 RepID=UPI00313B0016